MTIDVLPNVVYHGTSELYKESLENGVNLSYSKNNLDFGKGFYTTSNYNQAVIFANKRAEFSGNKPLVITYEVNKEIMYQLALNCLFFKNTDEQWYEFIFNNRVKNENIISEFHNKNCLYDIVYGSVADGAIGLLTRKARDKKVDFQEFVKSVKPYNDYNQLSFHTNDSLKALMLSNVKIIENAKEDALCLFQK